MAPISRSRAGVAAVAHAASGTGGRNSSFPQSVVKLAKEMELHADDPAALAAVGKFILEGLYVNDRTSKCNARGKTFFKR